MNSPFNYNEYISSESWQRRREEYFRHHKKLCVACRSKDGIHLHHLSYDSVFDEPDRDLMPLCQRCHTQVHFQRNAGEDLRTATIRVVKWLRELQCQKQRREAGKALGLGTQPDAIFQQIRETQHLKARTDMTVGGKKHMDHLRSVEKFRRQFFGD